jgi:hypothetical protein
LSIYLRGAKREGRGRAKRRREEEEITNVDMDSFGFV